MIEEINGERLPECPHPEWNISAVVSLIEDPPIAAGQFLVKIEISCNHCGMALHSIDDGKVLPYLETVMFK